MVNVAGDLAAPLGDPLVDGLGAEPQLPAAGRGGPARRDDVVGGLAPELVGVLGGWIRHGIVLSRRLVAF